MHLHHTKLINKQGVVSVRVVLFLNSNIHPLFLKKSDKLFKILPCIIFVSTSIERSIWWLIPFLTTNKTTSFSFHSLVLMYWGLSRVTVFVCGDNDWIARFPVTLSSQEKQQYSVIMYSFKALSVLCLEGGIKLYLV